jgi:hypothetical protein
MTVCASKKRHHPVQSLGAVTLKPTNRPVTNDPFFSFAILASRSPLSDQLTRGKG